MPNDSSKQSSSVKTKVGHTKGRQGGQKLPKADIIIDESAPQKTHGKWFTKKRLLIGVAIFGVIAVIAAIAWAMFGHPNKPIIRKVLTKTVKTPPKPKTTPSPLTGVEVAPELAEHPVVSVIIENLYPNARPQSGLSSAGVVYEALAEGGITRYQAFFGDTMPSDIGPVRSIRTYFVRWGLEYGVPVTHAGGNADALDLIVPLGMKNLDQFANGSYFRRINTRYAPHNLYTTGSQLDKLMQDRGFYTKPSFTPWLRKNDNKATTPSATTITIDPSYYDYRVTFKYDPTDNSYNRFIRGVADVDANGNTPVKPKNIIVLKAATSTGTTRAGEQTVIIQTVGSGTGVAFLDGVATNITWSKPSDKARTQFLDASGKEISLNRGQTWVTVIPLEKTVSYQ